MLSQAPSNRPPKGSSLATEAGFGGALDGAGVGVFAGLTFEACEDGFGVADSCLPPRDGVCFCGVSSSEADLQRMATISMVPTLRTKSELRDGALSAATANSLVERSLDV